MFICTPSTPASAVFTVYPLFAYSSYVLCHTGCAGWCGGGGAVDFALTCLDTWKGCTAGGGLVGGGEL